MYLGFLVMCVFSGFMFRFPSVRQWAPAALASSIVLLVAPAALTLLRTFTRLEYFIRVIVVLTLVASIGLPLEWIPIVHNPIDWGFIVMGLVYFFFLLWD